MLEGLIRRSYQGSIQGGEHVRMSISSTGWFSSKVHTQAVLEVLQLRHWSRPPINAFRQLVYIAARLHVLESKYESLFRWSR
jgi:hypothetical protein